VKFGSIGSRIFEVSSAPLPLIACRLVTVLRPTGQRRPKTLGRELVVSITLTHAVISWDHKLITFSNSIDGDEWQEFVLKLLYRRYGTDLIEVPDQHKGDSGVEAFSLDGSAFQCYSPEGEHEVAEICSKHKNKITRDINKFKKNKKRLNDIFGTTKIRRWVLIVPSHCSSDVVTHCQSKTSEVRNVIPPLTYVTDDFQVLTVDGYRFLAIEIAALTSSGSLLVEATETNIELNDIVSFSAGHSELAATLQVKLSTLPLLKDSVECDNSIKKLLRMYLLGGNAIAYYDAKYPYIADKIRSLKQSKSTALEIDSAIQNLTVAGTREKFESELIDAVPSLGRETAMVLSYASVAEWLMVCPLKPRS